MNEPKNSREEIRNSVDDMGTRRVNQTKIFLANTVLEMGRIAIKANASQIGSQWTGVNTPECNTTIYYSDKVAILVVPKLEDR